MCGITIFRIFNTPKFGQMQNKQFAKVKGFILYHIEQKKTSPHVNLKFILKYRLY